MMTVGLLVCVCNRPTHHSVTPLLVPNAPALRVILPRFSTTYLVWSDSEPFVGDIIGVEIRYLIDCVPQNIPEQGGGVNQYSVSGIKGSEGKTHSISLRARTTAGWGPYSTPVVFIFRPIGEIDGMYVYIYLEGLETKAEHIDILHNIASMPFYAVHTHDGLLLSDCSCAPGGPVNTRNK